MVGISKECLEWMQHQYFKIVRSRGKVNLCKMMISDSCYDRLIDINKTSLHFKMFKSNKWRSMFLNIDLNHSILEWYD
jgi:hypothetical protein